jgi:hypothetical protein
MKGRYKKMQDGTRDKEDNPFYKELHSLFSSKSMKRDREKDKDLKLSKSKDTSMEDPK